MPLYVGFVMFSIDHPDAPGPQKVIKANSFCVPYTCLWVPCVSLCILISSLSNMDPWNWDISNNFFPFKFVKLLWKPFCPKGIWMKSFVTNPWLTCALQFTIAIAWCLYTGLKENAHQSFWNCSFSIPWSKSVHVDAYCYTCVMACFTADGEVHTQAVILIQVAFFGALHRMLKGAYNSGS